MALTGLLSTQHSQPGALSLGEVPTPVAATLGVGSALVVSGVRIVGSGATSSASSSLTASAGVIRHHGRTILLRDASGLLVSV